ncbi:MAG: hypothetical protein WCT14_20555, partial [Treponemataceae bacterium]
MSSIRVKISRSFPLFFAFFIVFSLPLGAQSVLSFSAALGAAGETRILTVPKSGCYVFRAEGPGGAALTLVDRMYGRIGQAIASGAASDASGRSARFTTFLESGEYRIALNKPSEFGASASVDRFREKEEEIGQTDYGRFRDLKIADGEAVNFTIRVGADRRLRFFALGRSLGGMKLFRAGGWAT